MTSKIPTIHQLTENALLLDATETPDLPTQQRIWHLVGQLREIPEVCGALVEIVPGMGNLMVVCRPEMTSRLPDISDLLRTLWQQTESVAAGGRLVEIPTRYGGEDGPDMELVAAHTGLTEDEIILLHSQVDYQVYCLGFQPGFAYLGGMDPRLAIPRRSTPRLSTPAGSVGIGGTQTGVYPGSTPGGWQIIGRTDLSLFDIEKLSPCLLQPGDNVRFVPL